MKVAVIGGGPAGMMAAITSAKQKNEVYLFEKNNKLGKKLLITGKGRCNITSNLEMDEFIKNVPGNGRFLFSVFQNFTNEDIIELLNKNGVKTKVERGNRVFPESDKSLSVLEVFEKEIKRNNVNVCFNSKVEEIKVLNNSINKIVYVKDGKKIEMSVDKVIIATGGATYPLTGSTGDGYKIVEKIGHTIIDIRPSLVPLTSGGKSLNICKELQGLSLRNVEIELIDKTKNKKIYSDFGEMMFTHFGVTGPIILSSSAHIIRYKNIESLFKSNNIELKIDLKPALSEEKLEARIRRDFEANKNKDIRNVLGLLLPQKMIQIFLNIIEIDGNKKINEITKIERKKIIDNLKSFKININGFRPIEEGIITAGGVNVKEIDPKTMESKIVKGLFFAGEIIDVDAYTGGFNLQIAYSTGYTAGL